MTAPTWHVGSASATSGTTSIGITIPATASVGDFCVIAIATYIASSSTGSGWFTGSKLLGHASGNDGTQEWNLVIYGLTLQSGQPGATTSITGLASSTNQHSAILIGCWSNCGGADITSMGTLSGSTSGSITAPAVIPAWSNDTRVGLFLSRDTATGTPTWTLPGGTWTSREVYNDNAQWDALLADTTSTFTAFTSSGTATATDSKTGGFPLAATIMLQSSVPDFTSTATLIPSFSMGGRAGNVAQNSAWPQLVYEVAFASGANSTGPYAWSDISGRVETFSSQIGRSYELGSPSTGTGGMQLVNSDGAFDPTNTASPYYPNVLPMRRCRLSAIWAGTTYPVWSGFVDRWPQSWDTLRFGHGQTETVDALATLTATLDQVAISAIVSDAPAHMWDCTQQVFGTFATPWANAVYPEMFGSAASLTAVTAPGYTGGGSMSGAVAHALDSAAIGASVDGMAGWYFDVGDNVNIGYTLKATAPTTWLPTSSGVHSWEIWWDRNAANFSSGHSMTVLRFDDATPTTWLKLAAGTGGSDGSAFILTVNDAAGNTATVSFGSVTNATYHLVLVYDTSHGFPIVTAYDNGVVTAVLVATTVGVPTGNVATLYTGGFTEASSVGAVAHYTTALTQAQVSAHYNAWSGFPGDTTGTRIGRLLDWANWNGPTSLDTGKSTMQAAAGLAGSQIDSAIQQVTETEFGNLFPDASGNLVFWDRNELSAATSVLTFGDNPGEIPYEGDIQFGFDRQYVYDTIEITQGGSATATVKNTSVVVNYPPQTFSRTTYTNTAAEPLSYAQWLSANYAAPKLRVETLSVGVIKAGLASSANVGALLGLRIGQVVTVNRRPQGAPQISATFRVEQIGHAISSSDWVMTFQLSPVLTAPGW